MKLRNVAYIIFACLSLFVMIMCFFPVMKSDRKSEIYLYIERDDIADSVYSKIKGLSVFNSLQFSGLKICGFFMNYSDHVYSGKYLIENMDTPFSLMRKLRGGKQTPVRITIPIVHTLNDLSSRLSKVTEPDSSSFIDTFLSPEVLREYNLDSTSVMCMFIPNTYEVYWDITPIGLLKRIKREHDNFWTEERREKAKAIGLTTNEVYTLASVVQQETENKEERPIIAGMYLNRLKKQMKLQADPTVKFALQDFSLRRITYKHLKYDSPYNTYLYEGLPIGPICVPSLNAIESVLNHSDHDYLYMCAKEDLSGTHNFSKSFKEHSINAKRYSNMLNERRIYK